MRLWSISTCLPFAWCSVLLCCFEFSVSKSSTFVPEARRALHRSENLLAGRWWTESCPPGKRFFRMSRALFGRLGDTVLCKKKITRPRFNCFKPKKSQNILRNSSAFLVTWWDRSIIIINRKQVHYKWCSQVLSRISLTHTASATCSAARVREWTPALLQVLPRWEELVMGRNLVARFLFFIGKATTATLLISHNCYII
jgi:hypothetical protein